MSTFSHKLTFKTSQGSSYVIDFTIFEGSPLSDEIVVYDLLLKQEVNKGLENYEVLSFLGNEVLRFLEAHSGIIYFYCDHADIEKNERNKYLSNQEFRNRIFSAMFERKRTKSKKEGKTFNFILRNIQIKDPDGDHFISLISKSDHQKQIDNLGDQILSLNEK